MDSEKTDKYKGIKLALFVFECAMAILYVVLGIILLFTPFFKHPAFHSGLRIGLGIIFELYGVFRVYRAYVKITLQNE